MQRGIIALGSNMIYLQQRMNTLANNIANADTPGYKRDVVIGRSFNSFISSEFEKYFPPAENRYNSGMVNFKPGVYVDQIITDFSQGGLEETGKASDLSLRGRGFIAVQGPLGELYKRNVSLDVDPQGYLADASSGRLMGQNGHIWVGENEFNIDDMGRVYTDGFLRGSIRLVDFLNTDALVRSENGIFTDPQGNANILNGAEAVFLQGFVESSNTNLTEEMVTMTEVIRKYETSQRTIQMMDHIYSIAVNELGKV